jgi:hypothetical protein
VSRSHSPQTYLIFAETNITLEEYRLLGFVDYSYLLTLVHRSWIASTLKMEAILSSEMSVNKILTQRHIPEDGILHSHRREHLKS